jgi:hypothetical protein
VLISALQIVRLFSNLPTSAFYGSTRQQSHGFANEYSHLLKELNNKLIIINIIKSDPQQQYIFLNVSASVQSKFTEDVRLSVAQILASRADILYQKVSKLPSFTEA